MTRNFGLRDRRTPRLQFGLSATIIAVIIGWLLSPVLLVAVLMFSMMEW